MYKIQAVILSISRIRDNQTRIVMLSGEYGKITGWWNKKNITGIDIGDIAEILISREGGKNTIKTVDIRTPGWSKDWSYERLVAYMETLKIVNTITLEGIESSHLYREMTEFIIYGAKTDISGVQHTVFQMRILKSLGSMDRSILGSDPILLYIYDHISTTPLSRILQTSNVRTEHALRIQQANLHSLYTLAH